MDVKEQNEIEEILRKANNLRNQIATLNELYKTVSTSTFENLFVESINRSFRNHTQLLADAKSDLLQRITERKKDREDQYKEL